MKKIICLILFILIAGYVFFAGWTQMRVKTDSCGIVKSKLGGVKEKVVLPGKFSWNWEFIIPKNAKLEQFSMVPYSAEKTISGQMPANELYTIINNDTMNYFFNFSISLSIEPKQLVSLVQKNTISTDEDLKAYLSNIADYVCQQAASYYLSKAQAALDFNPESVKRSELIRALSIYDEYPGIDIAVIALTDYKIPNYNLYNKFQSMIIQDPSLLKNFVTQPSSNDYANTTNTLSE